VGCGQSSVPGFLDLNFPRLWVTEIPQARKIPGFQLPAKPGTDFRVCLFMCSFVVWQSTTQAHVHEEGKDITEEKLSRRRQHACASIQA
jgi:hypothetical protein